VDVEDHVTYGVPNFGVRVGGAVVEYLQELRVYVLRDGAGARNIWGKFEMVFPYGTEEHPLYISNLNRMKRIWRRKVG
jgi:hypothetical protein